MAVAISCHEEGQYRTELSRSLHQVHGDAQMEGIVPTRSTGNLSKY